MLTYAITRDSIDARPCSTPTAFTASTTIATTTTTSTVLFVIVAHP
jgi:hypothetical protein